MYSTHYSAPAFVLFYLIRRHPKLTLKLQRGACTLLYECSAYESYNLLQESLIFQTDYSTRWLPLTLSLSLPLPLLVCPVLSRFDYLTL